MRNMVPGSARRPTVGRRKGAASSSSPRRRWSRDRRSALADGLRGGVDAAMASKTAGSYAARRDWPERVRPTQFFAALTANTTPTPEQAPEHCASPWLPCRPPTSTCRRPSCRFCAPPWPRRRPSAATTQRARATSGPCAQSTTCCPAPTAARASPWTTAPRPWSASRPRSRSRSSVHGRRRPPSPRSRVTW